MKWEVMLTGHVFDLEDLPHHFDTDPKVHVEGGHYWLTSSSFEELSEATQVREAASVIVARINGAMRLHDSRFQIVSLANRYRSERGEQVVLGVGTVIERLKVGRIAAPGGGPAMRPRGPREYANLASEEPAVADVPFILGKGDLDWYDLYKVFEILRGDIGSEKEFRTRRWATKAQLSAFRASANHPGVSGQAARHAVQKEATPKQTMTIDQARAFIADLVRTWVRWCLSTGRD